MKERPIIFSGAMVVAILNGTKTQTRRVIRSPHAQEADCWSKQSIDGVWESGIFGEGGPVAHGEFVRCPYGVPGDRLWVKETWRTMERDSDMLDGVLFAADGSFVAIHNSEAASNLWCDAYDNGRHGHGWRPSIFMPRWASRITIEVVSVRVQRLQEISDADAVAEGVVSNRGDGETWYAGKARAIFEHGWDWINCDRAPWASNPWVWCITFRRIE